MTTQRSPRFDRVLPGLFDELAAAREPAYLEAAIERASARVQRPAWTFPERWLPMQFTSKVAMAPQFPLRQVGVLAVIALLLAALLAVYIGASSQRLPEPYGPAGNGVIALARDGDILTVDPVTGTATTIVGGPEDDSGPVFSGDGTRVAFMRAVEGSSDLGLLFVANADGTNLIQLTPEPIRRLFGWTFSPNGRDLLMVGAGTVGPTMLIAPVDASAAPRALAVQLASIVDQFDRVAYRPPDGAEILFASKPPGAAFRGLSTVDVATGQSRALVAAGTTHDIYGPTWSPNGDWIAYGQFTPAASITSRVHIMRADGSGDRLFDAASGTFFDFFLAWSNDSELALVGRGYAQDASDIRIAVVGLDPATPSVELDCSKVGLASCDGTWIFSPDDTQLLGKVAGDGPERFLVADPRTGEVKDAPWSGTTGEPSWQRVRR